MLVRRSVFDELGGLDDSFPSAYNDVDFCFRARQRGYRIVFAAAAELIHFEGATYGNNHYSNAGQEQERNDRLRMLKRWSDLYGDDPYYNPNLSLVIGSEWGLACPPRQTPKTAAKARMSVLRGGDLLHSSFTKPS
jgi:GT2 family glycosyltransferase